MGEVHNRSAGARPPPLKQGDRSWAWVTGCSLLPFPWPPACPKSPKLENLHLTKLGFQTSSAAIPFIQIWTRMAPTVPRSKGKGAALGEGDAPASLPKGSWEGSWVKERRIELLCQGQVIPSEDLMSYHPASG
jgi:hypothetical protein